jgi:hypothetical protein
MGCIGDMLLHRAILYVVVDVITSIICTTYTYKVLHKVFFPKLSSLRQIPLPQNFTLSHQNSNRATRKKGTNKERKESEHY